VNKIIYILFFALSFCSLKEEGIPESRIRPGMSKTSWPSQVLGHFVVSESPFSAVSVDFDGDQLPDLAYTSGNGAQSNLFIQLSSRPRIEWLGSAGSQLWLRVEGLDVNNDHLLDLVMIGVSRAIPAAVFLGDGKGNFKSVNPWNFFGTYPHNRQTITLPEDSKVDIAAIIPDQQEHFDHSFLEFRPPPVKTQRLALCEGRICCQGWLSPHCSPRSPPPLNQEIIL
jgi:hypothetical protein